MRSTSGRFIVVAALLLMASAPFVLGSSDKGRAPNTRKTETALNRSPSDLALTPDGRWAVTANTTSNTASLVDLKAGKATSEVAVGKRPLAVALSHDGSRAVVSNWLSDSVTLLRVAPPRLEPIATMPVGDEPRGVAFSKNGARVFVVLSGEDAVAVVDLEKRKVVARAAVGREPWHLALAPDGQRLAVGNTFSRTVSVLEASSLRLTHTVQLRGRNVRHLAVAPNGAWAYVPFVGERGRSTTKQHIDRGWVIGNRLCRIPLNKEGPREAIAMDTRGRAVGDLDGVAVGPKGWKIAVTAGGAHELILMRTPLPFVAYGGPDDHIDPELLRDTRRFRRVALGGRPLGVAFTPDGRRVVVANYLSDSLQVVDFASAKVTATISLGGPPTQSLARRGEAIFYDAHRSFGHWFSCHSCHTEGHTNGGLFDTMNDGRYGNLKKVLSLRGVTKTGPWTWHGHQTDLRALLRNSFATTMRGPVPSEKELDALSAFLATLDFVPPARVDVQAVRRGEKLFGTKRCHRCHKAPYFTTAKVYQVGLESSDDAFRGFNPPSLRGVARRAPFLHDGRARTLKQVLQVHHRPSRVSGESDLTAEQLADLIEYLKSL